MSHIDQPSLTNGTALEAETTGKPAPDPPTLEEISHFRSIDASRTATTTAAADSAASSTGPTESHTKNVITKSTGVLQPFTNLPDFNNPDYFVINWVGQTNFLQNLPYGLYMLAFFSGPTLSPMQAIDVDRVEVTVLGRQSGEAVTINGNTCSWFFGARGDVNDFHQLSISAWKWVDAPVGLNPPPAHGLFYKLIGPA